MVDFILIVFYWNYQMRKMKIVNGKVRLIVDHEFEALTLMGDGGNVPWRLLDINIFVEDK